MDTPNDILGNGDLVPATCPKCGQERLVESWLARASSGRSWCEPCLAEENKRVAFDATQGAVQRRKEEFEKLCPSEFLDTDPVKLPNAALFEKVMSHKFGARSLLIAGPTGQGKSRCAWLLAKREFLNRRSVIGLNHSIAWDYMAKFGDSMRNAARWRNQLVETNILLLDDVFKGHLSDALQALLFSVIATRTEGMAPMIITANDSGESLSSRFTPDRGPALVKRLRDYCQIITVGPITRRQDDGIPERK